MKPFLMLAAAAFVLTAPFAPAPAGDAYDPANGKVLAYTCYGCHGIPGYRNAYPSYSVPKIAGQNFEYLVTALGQYRDGERPHPTMRAQAESYSEQEIRDIAGYLAGLAEDDR